MGIKQIGTATVSGVYLEPTQVSVMLGLYADNKTPAIILKDLLEGDHVATASVNLPGTIRNDKPQHMIVCKDYAENEGIWTGLRFAIDGEGNPIFKPTPTKFIVGLVSDICPTVELVGSAKEAFDELVRGLE
jgi:hypothetical protein